MADLSQMTSSASELPATHAPATAGGGAGWLGGLPGAVAGTAGRFLWSYGAILAFLLLWQLTSEFKVVDPSVIPPFSKVVAALVQGFVGGRLLPDLGISMARAGSAFGIAVAVAIPLGLFMGSLRRFEAFIDPLLQTFRQTSALAIYPIFILLLGLGETSKVTIICWAAFFPILLNTISGVKQVDHRLIEMARVFGASRAEVFRRVVLPAATPAIFVGLRLSGTISLLLLVAAEMIGAKKGLGFPDHQCPVQFRDPVDVRIDRAAGDHRIGRQLRLAGATGLVLPLGKSA
jgi:sulfonate transport system permease protein